MCLTRLSNRGSIEVDEKKPDLFVSTGTVSLESRTRLRITELPVGKWTQDYKEFLDNLLKDKNVIKNYSEHHTGISV